MKLNHRVILLLSVYAFFLLSISCQKTEGLKIGITKVDNTEVATGINPSGFNFSWKIVSEERNIKQTAFQLLVSKDDDFSTESVIWDSGKTDSEKSILVNYKGQKLQPGTTYFWKVKIWDNVGNESDWSETTSFTTALFSETEWEGAKWIAYDKMNPENRLVPGIHLPGKDFRGKELGFHKLPILRKEFEVKKELKQALVFVSGLGHYEMELNGKKVGDHFIAPGWTHYDETVLYNTFDLTNLLTSGQNAMGISLGNGFFIVPNTRYRKVMTAYGNPMMILKLQLNYDDGSSEIVVSDESWKTTSGPITFSSIYGGETYNATLEHNGWNVAGFDDSNWQDAIIMDAPCKELLPEKDYPVKLVETINVKTSTKIEGINNVWIYDFGQNASGVFEVSVKGNRGDSITITPAELLDDNGQANQKATGRSHFYTYVLKGDGVETWQPKFTYYGFRYIQVEGAAPTAENQKSGLPEIVEIKMLHNRNSTPETGSFHTSYELFNQIDTLIKWAIKSNLQSVLSDCPHREKLGWLEQTYLMGEGIHYNFDVYGLYSKIIDDMIIAQTPDGLVPDIAPEYVEFTGGFRDSPEWGSAAVILPWLIYKWYGDIEPMKKAWPMMEKYVLYLKSKSADHIVDYGLGDWFDLGPERPGFAQLTPVSLTATAIYYYDVHLLSQMAELLGKEDAGNLKNWAEEIKTSFNNKFYNPETGIYSTGSQTAIAMPLVVGLVDDENREKTVQTLVKSIHESGNALTAGDVGFHFLVRALADNDQGELLYKMNARDDVPGYGYQLKKGATALTESWPALEIVSNNHLMLGHIMEWLYGGLVGVSQTENSVGYKVVKIEPQIVGGIKSAKASFESPYGTISSSWENAENKFVLNVEIPANTSAEVIIPASNFSGISESGNPVSNNKSFEMQQILGKVKIQIGSGKYKFEVQK
jgi:hypothetical protein